MQKSRGRGREEVERWRGGEEEGRSRRVEEERRKEGRRKRGDD